MTAENVQSLIKSKSLPGSCKNPALVETHISWVILCDDFAFKIKKPIQYSFLDFSTLEKRLFYCRKEVRLNWRLTFNVYLDILPVKNFNGVISIGNKEGETIDYAVRMQKLDPALQMNILLGRDEVTKSDITSLARRIAEFHRKAEVVSKKNVMDLKNKFNDLGAEEEFLAAQLGSWSKKTIEEAIELSNHFLDDNTELLTTRLKNNCFRDVHGDLHSKNIFLLPEPVIFDCIEFNDDYRQIDILNEVAFLCMDLEALNHDTLAEHFVKRYCHEMGISLTESEQCLFTYYKAYRANVRAKVNSLRARSAKAKATSTVALAESQKYLNLMHKYLESMNIHARVF